MDTQQAPGKRFFTAALNLNLNLIMASAVLQIPGIILTLPG